MQPSNKALWLAVASHVTNFNQSASFQHSMFMMTSAPDDDKCDHEAAVSDVICVSVPHVQDGPRDESILATVAPSVGLLSTFQSLQFCVPTYLPT